MADAYASYPPMDIPGGEPWAVIDTSLGRMKFRLLPDEAELAVNSFLFLVNEGYFDGQVFHRVMPGFMAQTGDPTGTGTGGPGYKFAIEPPQRPYVRGTLAMANSGVPDSNGSQFFIVLDDLTALGKLDADYTIFGEVLVLETGEQHRPTLATIEKFNAVSVAAGPGGEVSVPLEPITIRELTIGFTVKCSGDGSFSGGQHCVAPDRKKG
jgi:cyclophilin family peptidyl-prolyl cis-trans isomerase